MNLLKRTNKNTPEFLVKQEKQRLSLLKNLSRAVKEVQLQFANQDPTCEEAGAIGDCRASQHVCSAFEEVLRHGLKPNWFGQGTLTFWPIVLKISRKQAIEYIGTLQHAQSDGARCRGWIRLAVNECSLESYINVMCQDKSLLSYYYESYSFARDLESVSALTQLLAGLSLITFKLTVDVASLEFDHVPEAHSDLPLRMNPKLISKGPVPASTVVASSYTKKGVHKKSHGKQDAMDVEDSSTVSSSCVSLDSRMEEFRPEVSTESNVNEEVERFYEDEDMCEESDRWYENGIDVEGSMESCENGGSEKLYENGGVEGSEGSHENGGIKGSHENRGIEGSEGSHENGGVEGSKGLQESGGVEGSEGSQEDGSVEGSQENRNVEGIGTGEWRGSGTLYKGEVYHGNMLVFNLDDEITVTQEHWTEPGIGTHQGVVEVIGQGDEQDQLARDEDDDLIDQVKSQDNQVLEDSPYQDRVDSSPLDREVMERQNTLVAEDEKTVLPHLNPFFPESSPPLNPFAPSPKLSVSPQEAGVAVSGFNPFLTDDPFHSSADNSATPTSSNPFQTCYGNPFDGVDHALRPQYSDKASSPSSSLDLPDSLSAHRPPHTSGSPTSLVSISPPNTSPGPLDERLGEAHTPSTPSASPNPSQSQTTEDLESLSGSSIDLSPFMDVPTPSEQSNPPQLNHLEDFFQPEMSIIELRLAIDRLKVELANSALEETEKKQKMRESIVDLQMKLQLCREEEEEGQLAKHLIKEISGHKFIQQPRNAPVGKRLCEGCGKRIRGIIQTWYLCKLCGFPYHKKCLFNTDRLCSAINKANKQKLEPVKYTLEVCPEKGLTYQHFRCSSCNIAFNNTTITARQCDYSGLYYCPTCHHNDQTIIPARVIHNWDFNPRKVCCRCRDFLELHSTKPLLRVQTINPLLYTYVQDLATIETLRKDVLAMKKYFLECPKAKEAQLLKRLDNFPHFKDEAYRFSIMDLKAVHSGDLLPELSAIHGDYSFHIKRECTVCSVKGINCALCNSRETLYPFDRQCRQCPKCYAIFHRECYSEMTTCPRCSRIRHHRTNTSL